MIEVKLVKVSDDEFVYPCGATIGYVYENLDTGVSYLRIENVGAINGNCSFLNLETGRIDNFDINNKNRFKQIGERAIIIIEY